MHILVVEFHSEEQFVKFKPSEASGSKQQQHGGVWSHYNKAFVRHIALYLVIFEYDASAKLD